MIKELATFPISSTNIFPQSNSVYGGQLLSEFNLRSLDTVSIRPSVKYSIGPSYTHSLDDFQVSASQSSQSILVIATGRAIVNGHYVENLSPMQVDLAAINSELIAEGSSVTLKGRLCVGIKAMYSTLSTMSGAMLVADNESPDMFAGVQLVVANEEDFHTPFDEDAPSSIQGITAHLKLATFSYVNQSISRIVDNTARLQYVPAERISNIEGLLGGQYISRVGMNPGKLYVFAGKGDDPDSYESTWCDATDSLMVWGDKVSIDNYSRTAPPANDKAVFYQDADKVKLHLHRKQVDGGVTIIEGGEEVSVYPPPVSLTIPSADYHAETPGVVSKLFTRYIKQVGNKINNFYHMKWGTQRAFIEERNDGDALPTIMTPWSVGDYVVIGHDYSQGLTTDDVSGPSSLYIVLPGHVTAFQYDAYIENPSLDQVPSGNVPTATNTYQSTSGIAVTNIDLVYEAGVSELEMNNGAPTGKILTGYEEDTPTYGYPIFYTEDNPAYGSSIDSNHGNFDYFTLTYYENDNALSAGTPKYRLFYSVSGSGKRIWSVPVWITGEMRYATETSIGGFTNVNPEDAQDNGYIYLDESGHLRLVDYSLLRSGTLAYQIGENQKSDSGLSAEEIQEWLNDVVNQRVAFPNGAQIANSEQDGSNPNIIHVHINISQEESSTIYIQDIDSRFGACVYVHFTGSADSNTTINILDCEKLRLDFSGLTAVTLPKVNIVRCEVYYEASTFEYAALNAGDTGMSDISIWYQQFESSDPALSIDGMTVRCLEPVDVPHELDFWNQTSADDDNHYYYALRSITFSSAGSIIGCELAVCNASTYNNTVADTGHSLVVSTGAFDLPQNIGGLMYPTSCCIQPMKISGQFISSYRSSSTDNDWVMAETFFTAVSGTYSPGTGLTSTGSISIRTDVYVIPECTGLENPSPSVLGIPGWESDTYHTFSGGIV